MMTLQIILFVLIWLITLNYILLILYFAHGLTKLPKNNINNHLSQNPSNFNSFTVIIAARNEENKIIKCLTSIALQDYPSELFEVIVVNDQSTDNTEQLINQFIDTASFKIRQLFTSGKGGKKEALRIGILASNNEKVITTDADCIVPHCWISEMNKWFQKTDAVFITGPVGLQPIKGFFNIFQCLEFNSLIASTAGSIGQGMPIMSNGANLGFDLKAYHTITETIPQQSADLMSQNYASGDDVFMMLSFKRCYGSNKISFMNSSAGIVYTETQSTLRDFLSQRSRWVSKSRGYSDWQVIYTAISILCFNTILLASIFLAPIQGLSLFPATPECNYLILLSATILFTTKTIADAVLLSIYLKTFGQYKLMRFLPLMELPVSFYTVVIGIIGNFKSFEWKGRAISRNK